MKAGGGATTLLIGCCCSGHDMFPVQIGDRRRNTTETQQIVADSRWMKKRPQLIAATTNKKPKTKRSTEREKKNSR